MERIGIPDLARRARENGAWLRLDPTTGNATLNDTAGDSWWGEVQQVVDYLKFAWNNYVVGMDAVKQQESVYQPLAEGTRELMRKLTSRETWSAWASAIVEFANPRRWKAENLRAPGLSGALLWVAAAAAVAAAVRWFVRRRKRRLSAAAPAAAKHSCAAPPVDFYVRLEQLLARHRLRRTPEQTQREFVQTACGELAESAATRGVASLPRPVVEAFYRVRFGGRPLDAEERQEVELALSALAAAPVPGTGGASSSADFR